MMGFQSQLYVLTADVAESFVYFRFANHHNSSDMVPELPGSRNPAIPVLTATWSSQLKLRLNWVTTT